MFHMFCIMHIYEWEPLVPTDQEAGWEAVFRAEPSKKQSWPVL